MAGLYTSIKADILTLWAANWSHATNDPPVLWRANDPDILLDPSQVRFFLRNEVDFGPERIIGMGGGRGRNDKVQFGSVMVNVFTARSVRSEDTSLELMHDAMAALRSRRVSGTYAGGSDLSFIGEGSGFQNDITEDGNWFMRGAMMVFEYRFVG